MTTRDLTYCCVKAALFSFHVIPYDAQNTTPHPPLNHPDGADPHTTELLPQEAPLRVKIA